MSAEEPAEGKKRIRYTVEELRALAKLPACRTRPVREPPSCCRRYPERERDQERDFTPYSEKDVGGPPRGAMPSSHEHKGEYKRNDVFSAKPKPRWDQILGAWGEPGQPPPGQAAPTGARRAQPARGPPPEAAPPPHPPAAASAPKKEAIGMGDIDSLLFGKSNLWEENPTDDPSGLDVDLVGSLHFGLFGQKGSEDESPARAPSGAKESRFSGFFSLTADEAIVNNPAVLPSPQEEAPVRAPPKEAQSRFSNFFSLTTDEAIVNKPAVMGYPQQAARPTMTLSDLQAVVPGATTVSSEPAGGGAVGTPNPAMPMQQPSTTELGASDLQHLQSLLRMRPGGAAAGLPGHSPIGAKPAPTGMPTPPNGQPPVHHQHQQVPFPHLMHQHQHQHQQHRHHQHHHMQQQQQQQQPQNPVAFLMQHQFLQTQQQQQQQQQQQHPIPQGAYPMYPPPPQSIPPVMGMNQQRRPMVPGAQQQQQQQQQMKQFMPMQSPMV